MFYRSMNALKGTVKSIGQYLEITRIKIQVLISRLLYIILDIWFTIYLLQVIHLISASVNKSANLKGLRIIFWMQEEKWNLQKRKKNNAHVLQQFSVLSNFMSQKSEWKK